MNPPQRLHIGSGLQARIQHDQQAIICGSAQLGQLVVIGNLVAYQPPDASSSASAATLAKVLEVASTSNQKAEAAYNDGVIQWEQVSLCRQKSLLLVSQAPDAALRQLSHSGSAQQLMRLVELHVYGGQQALEPQTASTEG